MKDIPNYEGLYAITENGEVWSYGGRIGANHKGKFLKTSIDKDGYKKLALKDSNGTTKYYRIGRLVLLTYKPNDNSSLQVNHKDGNRTNDILSNLEWVTCSENIQHSFKILGKNQKGHKNNAFKKWGYIINKQLIICDNISVDEWCFQNNIASSIIYTSIREKRELKQGRFKGYQFIRFGSTGQ